MPMKNKKLYINLLIRNIFNATTIVGDSTITFEYSLGEVYCD